MTLSMPEGRRPRRLRGGQTRRRLNLLVAPRTHEGLDRLANHNGRSLSSQTEILLELAMSRELAAFGEDYPARSPPPSTKDDLHDRLARLEAELAQLIEKRIADWDSVLTRVSSMLRLLDPTEIKTTIVHLHAAVPNLLARLNKLETALSDRDRTGAADTPPRSAETVPHTEPEPQQHHAVYVQRDPALLLPVQISISCGEDGSLALVYHHEGRVIREIPFDAATARQLRDQLLAASREPAGSPPIGLHEIAKRLRVSRRTVQRRMAEVGIRGTGRGRSMMLTDEEHGRLIEALQARGARTKAA
jgi:hypothetical protein